MAHDITVTAFFTPDVKAALDLRTHQYKLVSFDAGGVRLATANVGSGAVYSLANKPHSGEACSLVFPGNIAKAWADGAVVRNQALAVSGNTAGWVVAATSGNVSANFIGYAITAVASGSLCDVLLK